MAIVTLSKGFLDPMTIWFEIKIEKSPIPIINPQPGREAMLFFPESIIHPFYNRWSRFFSKIAFYISYILLKNQTQFEE
jgi:hypothetical protein